MKTRCDRRKKNEAANACELNYEKNAAIQIWFWGQSSLSALTRFLRSQIKCVSECGLDGINFFLHGFSVSFTVSPSNCFTYIYLLSSIHLVVVFFIASAQWSCHMRAAFKHTFVSFIAAIFNRFKCSNFSKVVHIQVQSVGIEKFWFCNIMGLF